MLPFMTDELVRGERIELRHPTQDDIVAFTHWANDMEYSRLLRRAWITFGSPEGMLGWFAQMEKDESAVPFSIYTREDTPRLVGLVVIKDIFWQARHCSFFIGIGQREDRGRGYGSDAVRVLLRYCFNEMNMHCVRLEVIAYNEAARRTYERIGFRHDGAMRAFVNRDGVYYDVECMSLLRSEWVDSLRPADQP